jgi:hypothetical protein
MLCEYAQPHMHPSNFNTNSVTTVNCTHVYDISDSQLPLGMDPGTTCTHNYTAVVCNMAKHTLWPEHETTITLSLLLNYCYKSWMRRAYEREVG